MVYPPHPYAESPAVEIPDFRRPDEYRALQLIAGIVAFIAAELISGLAMAAALILLPGAPSASASADARDCAFGIGLIVGGCAMYVFYLLIMRFIAHAPRHGLRGKSKVTEFLLGMILGTVLVSAAVGIIALFGGFRISRPAPAENMLPAFIMALGFGIGPAFMEELFFRGFLLRIFDAWWGWIASLLITSLLFGAVHITNPDATAAGAAAIAVEAGLLMGAAYLLTRRMWLAIGIHIAWNFVQAFVYSSPVSGTGDFTGLFEVAWHGPEWLTGGAMGIEGSLVTVVLGVIAGVGLLILAHRHRTLLPREAALGRHHKH